MIYDLWDRFTWWLSQRWMYVTAALAVLALVGVLLVMWLSFEGSSAVPSGGSEQVDDPVVTSTTVKVSRRPSEVAVDPDVSPECAAAAAAAEELSGLNSSEQEFDLLENRMPGRPSKETLEQRREALRVFRDTCAEFLD